MNVQHASKSFTGSKRKPRVCRSWLSHYTEVAADTASVGTRLSEEPQKD